MKATTKTERTMVFYREDAINAIAQGMSRATREISMCVDSNAPSVGVLVSALKNAKIEAAKRGIKIRYITEITNGNIAFCKELAKFVELRHLDGVRGNFGVSESEYMAVTTLQEAKPVTKAIYSNIKELVEEHQYFFETLWNTAIPAEQRIRELEAGVTIGRNEVMENPEQVQRLYLDLIQSAENEIMLLLPTLTAFKREEKMGIIKAIKDAASRAVKVRIMMPLYVSDEMNDSVMEEIELLRRSFSIDVRTTLTAATTTKPSNSDRVHMTVVVVDRRASLIMELKDDSKETFAESMGSTVYSTSKPRVMSFVTIFDNFWNQSDLYEQVRETNKKLERANEQLEVKDAMQKEFINIAAHELRTPIQPILGIADLLGSQFQEDKGEEQKPSKDKGEITKDELAILVRNAKRLERLTSNILDIARIESGKLRLNIHQFDLNDIISPLVADAKNEIIDKGIDVKVTYTPFANNIGLKGDKDRLSEVVWNLLNNAIKFTEAGEVSIAAEKDDIDNCIVVTVRDSGSGIDPEVLSKLFTKFVTKSERGTGLGLYISKTIIEAHGGKIWAENNKDGKGASFSFTIPLLSESL